MSKFSEGMKNASKPIIGLLTVLGSAALFVAILVGLSAVIHFIMK